jgi:fructose 1,6-bisphosphatase
MMTFATSDAEHFRLSFKLGWCLKISPGICPTKATSESRVVSPLKKVDVASGSIPSYVGHISCFDGPPRVIALGFQLADGRLVGPRGMFDDPGFDETGRLCNVIADHLRRHGPFEPHRLPMDEMEYTTLPEVMAKLEGR